MEVLSDDCHGRRICKPVGDSTEHPLNEDELPIRLANAREHHRSNVNDRERPYDYLFFCVSDHHASHCNPSLTRIEREWRERKSGIKIKTIWHYSDSLLDPKGQ